MNLTGQCSIVRDSAELYETLQDSAMQNSAWQIQDSARQCMRLHRSIQQCSTMRDCAEQCKTLQVVVRPVQDSARQCERMQETVQDNAIQWTTEQDNAGQCKTLQDIANSRQCMTVLESAVQRQRTHDIKRRCRQWKLCKPSWNRYSAKLYTIMRDSAQHKSAGPCRTMQDFAGQSDWLNALRVKRTGLAGQCL